MAETIVDVETGEVEVTDFVAAFDIGRAINPRLIEGQIEGGVAMGLGYALMENVVVDNGYIQNLSLQNYLIPTSLDVPKIKPIILEIISIQQAYYPGHFNSLKKEIIISGYGQNRFFRKK